MEKPHILLVPVDGSRPSLRALAHVIRRVSADRALHLIIVNAQPPLPQGLFVSRAMIVQYQDSQGKQALARARRMLRRSHLKADFLLRIGEPGEVIVKTARLHHCDEIIMGSRGLGNLKRLLLGSVTTKVIHATRIPVTVVP